MIKRIHIWIRKLHSRGDRRPAPSIPSRTPGDHPPTARSFPLKSMLYRPIDDFSDEELLIALIEGDLQPADREKVLQRIKRSTSLQQLYRQLQLARMSPPAQKHFPRKTALYHSIEDFDELIMALIDGTLTESEEKLLYSQWSKDAIEHAIAQYRALQLRPNEQITYPHKSRLKRHPRTKMLRYPLSAAAAIAALLALSWWWMVNNYPSANVSSITIAQTSPTADIPTAISHNIPAPKLQPKDQPQRPHAAHTSDIAHSSPMGGRSTPPRTTNTERGRIQNVRSHTSTTQRPPHTPAQSSIKGLAQSSKPTIPEVPFLPSVPLNPIVDSRESHEKELISLPIATLSTSDGEDKIPIVVEISRPYVELWKSLQRSRQNFLRGKRQNRLILSFDYGPIGFYRSVEI